MAKSEAGKGTAAKAKPKKPADTPAKRGRTPAKKTSTRAMTADERLGELTTDCKMPVPYPAYVIILESQGKRKVMTGTHFGTINTPNPKFDVSLENVCTNDKAIPILKLKIEPV